MDFRIINVEPSVTIKLYLSLSKFCKGMEISKLVLGYIAVESIVGATNDNNIFLSNFYNGMAATKFQYNKDFPSRRSQDSVEDNHLNAHGMIL
jgi:hypothetical protein